jgi:phosphoribosylanthranilate isomerase
VDFCQELRSQLPKGIEIIKVFSIQDEFDFSALKPFEDAIIFILKENTWRKRNNFRLDSIKKISFDKAVFSQRWIGLEELKAVQEITKQIYAIDVNSKFEIEPGLKKNQ